MIKNLFKQALRENYYSFEKTPTSDDNPKSYEVMDTTCNLKLSDGKFVQFVIVPMTNKKVVGSIYCKGYDSNEFELKGAKNTYFTKFKKNLNDMNLNLLDEGDAKNKFQAYLSKIFI